MEKKKWNELFKSMSENYENYYEKYLHYRKLARKEKKKSKRELYQIIEWTFSNIRDHYELGEILLDVCLRTGIGTKNVRKPEYFLEIMQEVLRDIRIQMEHSK